MIRAHFYLASIVITFCISCDVNENKTVHEIDNITSQNSEFDSFQSNSLSTSSNNEKNSNMLDLNLFWEEQFVNTGIDIGYSLYKKSDLSDNQEKVLKRNKLYPNSNFIQYDFNNDGRIDVGVFCKAKKEFQKVVVIFLRKKLAYDHPMFFHVDYGEGFGFDENGKMIIPGNSKDRFYSYISYDEYWQDSYKKNLNNIDDSRKEKSKVHFCRVCGSYKTESKMMFAKDDLEIRGYWICDDGASCQSIRMRMILNHEKSRRASDEYKRYRKIYEGW